MRLSVRKGVELFHLAFLGELGSRLDRDLYAIKGGCNLRFFFHSVRYSEDLDIDIETTGTDTLRAKVDKLLGAQSLLRLLGAHAITLNRVTAPKQTGTTQRWKLGLVIEGHPAHTKIEFSRRGLQPGIDFGPVDPVLVSAYGLTTTLVSHYDRGAAARQKVQALAGRAQTQARDVFDLGLLLNDETPVTLQALDAETRKAAQARAMGVDFDMFRGQVLAYLPPERARLHDAASWDETVLRVVDALQAPGAR